MKNKLECVLLVDDDEVTNIIHQFIVNKAGITKHIQTVSNGRDAIDFITSKGKFEDNDMKPELILLDLSMPVLDGWGFLDEFKQLDTEYKNSTIIIMLSTSLDSANRKKADSYNEISGYRDKPLTTSVLDDILQKHFAKRFQEAV
jgi:CheY-like chemotaxis protein